MNKLIEAMAKSLYEEPSGDFDWDELSPENREHWYRYAQAAWAAGVDALSDEMLKSVLANAYRWNPIDPAKPMNAIVHWTPDAFRQALKDAATEADDGNET